MKIFRLLVLISSLPLLLSASLQAQEGDEPNADQILRMARSVFANERVSFEGQLKPDNRRDEIDLAMSVEGQDMVVTIKEDPETDLYLSLGGGGGQLEWAQPGTGRKRDVMASEGLGQQIRGTDLAYEDIGMRFLYWENAQKAADAKVSARDCWTVLARNPGQNGPYGFVYVRVDKGTGALMQVLGYNREGRLVKRFKVDDVQLHRGQYYLRRMRIESIDNHNNDDQSDDDVIGRTYLVLGAPERSGNGF